MGSTKKQKKQSKQTKTKKQTTLIKPRHYDRWMWIGLLIAIVVGFIWKREEPPFINVESNVPTEPAVPYRRWDVNCSDYRPFVPGCHQKGTKCGRVLRDNFITSNQVDRMVEIAEKGMKNRSKAGGPTIMDINSGFIKDGDGLVNLYSNSTTPFSKDDYTLYKNVIESIREAVKKEFQLSQVFLTAPTFLTRLVGNSTWKPQDMHDEYWHPHVDKDNTRHYDYSGLVYLSNYAEDFQGGLFTFIDGNERFNTIEPRKGRLLMFTAGGENLHQAQIVESGVRYLMSMWFTCDSRFEFATFLDRHVA